MSSEQRTIRRLADLWAHGVTSVEFDVVIVGTGYGGAAAAATLAGTMIDNGLGGQRPLRIAVFERGKEYRPGDFPARMDEWPAHARFAREGARKVTGNHEGLFDMRLGSDVVALVANGVGGGSLINAGVLLEPDLGTLPAGSSAALRRLLQSLAAEGHYDEAKNLLGGFSTIGAKKVCNTIDLHPDVAGKPLQKTAALRSLAPGCDVPTVPISVAMNSDPNSAGVELPICTLCGDCMTGCNVGAKNSLDVNLLALARERGAVIYTGATVLSVRRERDEQGDERRSQTKQALQFVRVVHTDPVLQAQEVTYLTVVARMVILSAGTFGSTEILLRSRDERHVFSERLGMGFSCNGDNIGAVTGLGVAANGRADEDTDLDQRRVGPTITASMRLPGGSLVQEFSVPGPMGWLYDEVVTTAEALGRLTEADESSHGTHDDADRWDPLAVDPDAIGRSLLVGVIGHDDARGVIEPVDPIWPRDRVPQAGLTTVRWPQARHGERLQSSRDELEARVRKAGARLIDNPMWKLLPGELEQLVSQPRGPVLTVHPLGGCAVGKPDGDERGVVDEWGRVRDYGRGIDGEGSVDWFGTLIVLDGSILGGSLGVNPALTITAAALRGAAVLRELWLAPGQRFGTAPGKTAPTARITAPSGRGQRERSPDRRVTPLLHSDPNAAPAPTQTTIQVIERLTGGVSVKTGAGRPPRDYVLELTLAYEPHPLRGLMSRLHREIEFGADKKSTLRIFDRREWEENLLRVESDATRDRFVRYAAPVSGKLELLARESSSACQRRRRSVWAWLWNRGFRDTWSEIFPREPRAVAGRSQSWCSRVRSMLDLASRAGEVRTLRYQLKLGAVTLCHDERLRHILRAWNDETIEAVKRLTYGRRANPWRQLTELELTEFPALAKGSRPILKVDARFMANRGVALFRITDQANHARALADLASFVLYLARVLLYIHLWTFRKPDSRPPRQSDREAGPIAGLPAPEVTDLLVDHYGPDRSPVYVRLTHYPPSRGRVEGPPLVMLHGYSVSGNTFTHPSLSPSAAKYFHGKDRDVWVLDLRTSTAMPTCTQPWSMEEAALIDLPAALLHIRKLTGKRVDVLAHCIGCVMLSMAVLADPRDIRRDRIRLGVDVFLSGEQLGTLAAFNGASPDGREHPCIRRIVLSQKGPVLRYTDDNVLRAFLLQSVRRWLITDTYSFQPPDKPTVADELLDRFLASMPYPDDDYDVENPRRPWVRTGWTATRHRMDALYGRDFNAANLRPETLDAIDDLFGSINLDTVAQTIHFARVRAITNQRGDGEFVTRRRMLERWSGIRTLAIHGQQNGLVDVSTQQLLSTYFAGPATRFEALDSSVPPYDTLGHQDVLIGKTSKRVFRDIERFLADPAEPPPLAAPITAHPTLDLPHIGPRIVLLDGALEPGQRRIGIACRSDPNQGPAKLLLVPVTERNGAMRVVRQVPVGECPAGDSRGWLQVVPANTVGVDGWLALLAYDFLDSTALTPPRGIPGVPRNSFSSGDIKLSGHALDAFGWRPAGPNWSELTRQWLSENRALARQAFVARTDVERAECSADPQSAKGTLHFAFASCQYPAGLFDRAIAHERLEALATKTTVASAAVSGPIDLVVFTGDQIYADATAGLVDPVRRDERFERPWTQALRVPAIRTICRRVPVRMMIDDHELADNWHPLPAAVESWRPDDVERIVSVRRNGYGAWAENAVWPPRDRPSNARRFGPHDARSLDMEPMPTADQCFVSRGHPFFLLDTRLGRSARGSLVDRSEQRLIRVEQMRKLKCWLLRYADAPKFVVTPALLLPRRLATSRDPGAAIDSDAWDGYPKTMAALFDFIVRHQIRRTVFLSGDEHHSLLTRATLSKPNFKSVRVVSIHSSGLYAPFPFANGRPQDLALAETFTAGHVNVRVHGTRLAPAGDGFAVVRLEAESSKLLVEFYSRGHAMQGHRIWLT